MIKALIEIGRSVRDLYPMPLVEIPYRQKGTTSELNQSQKKKRKDEPKVLVVELHSNTENFLETSEIYIIDYTPDDVLEKYFFRDKTSANGPAESLSFKLPPKPSTLRQRLGILTLLGYKADIETIAEKIEQKLEDFRKKGEIRQSTLVVLKIDGKWPAENKKLRENFVKNFLEKLGSYKGKAIWKTRAVCHGCGEEKLVYGGVGDLLKFYTVDKYGYAPELNPKIAWKQYALCEDCIFDLERGKRAVDDFLKWRFYGKEFWLLPVSSGELRRILDNFKQLHVELSGKPYFEGFESFEDKLIYEASRQETALSYHFIFAEDDQQAIRIRLHIEEVLPSVLSQYVNTKIEHEQEFRHSIYQVVSNTKNLYFNFFSSPSLRANKQRPGFTDENFYMLVDKVFRRSPVDEKYLISKAMSRISKDMVETEEHGKIPLWPVLETLLSLEFLLKWGILKRKTGGVVMNTLPYEEFFERHSEFFNHPAKRGLVLLGVLVQNFLNYQHHLRGSTPFMKVLKNLILDQKDVQKVYVTLQNKMNEYEIGHWWPELREGVSLSFIEAGDKWPLSPEEIGFYIAVGMALHSHPAFRKEEHEEQ